MVGLEEIELAARRISGIIRTYPAQRSEPLSVVCHREIFVKPEHLQRGGSFKIRGAFNFIAQLVEDQPDASVVAASAGNHAQGVALGAQLRGLQSTIFMPVTSPLPKVEATRGYGAQVVLEGSSVDVCIELAQAFSERSGAVYVPPFDHPFIIAGQGTLGLELIDEVPSAGIAIVPVGGGGLISGVSAALSLRRSGIRVIGVEPKSASSMSAARNAGHPVVLDTTMTMADGVAVRSVSALTLKHVQAYVDDMVTVDEGEISRAVLLLLERAKWLVEPAGALALAAILSGKISGNESVIALLTGGNIDPLLLIRLIEHGMSAAGRYLMIRVVLSDTPGALANLTSKVAELGLNVLSVEHHRSGVTVNVDEVEVYLTVETRDLAHRNEVIPALAAQGWTAELMH